MLRMVRWTRWSCSRTPSGCASCTPCAAGGTLTTSQLCDRLPDVSKATVYRHVDLLCDGGVLEVAGSAGSAARSSASTGCATDRAVIDAGMLESLLGRLPAQLRHRHGRPARRVRRLPRPRPADPAADLVGYRQHALWLSRDELLELIGEMRRAIVPRLANPADAAAVAVPAQPHPVPDRRAADAVNLLTTCGRDVELILLGQGVLPGAGDRRAPAVRPARAARGRPAHRLRHRPAGGRPVARRAAGASGEGAAGHRLAGPRAGGRRHHRAHRGRIPAGRTGAAAGHRPRRCCTPPRPRNWPVPGTTAAPWTGPRRARAVGVGGARRPRCHRPAVRAAGRTGADPPLAARRPRPRAVAARPARRGRRAAHRPGPATPPRRGGPAGAAARRGGHGRPGGRAGQLRGLPRAAARGARHRPRPRPAGRAPAVTARQGTRSGAASRTTPTRCWAATTTSPR